MKFINLYVEFEGHSKTFEFDEKNLIFSQSNSVGKSTLLRLLFFSLGYSVPGTKKFKFYDCYTKVFIRKDTSVIEIERSKDIVKLTIDNKYSNQFIIPQQEYELLSLIWGTENKSILKNILGAIYFDQEKGWTLLNRGKVIGNIQFNIDELIRGLASIDISELAAEKNVINIEQKKYQHLKTILEYKEQLNENQNGFVYADHLEKLYTLLDQKNLERNEIEKEIKSIKSALRNNEAFINYIENMRITVRDPETLRVIPVSKSTVEYFDENQEYLETQLKIERIKLADVKEEMGLLRLQIEEQGAQLNLQSEIERFNEKVVKLEFDYQQIDRIIEDLKKKKSNVDKKIKEATYSDNELIKAMQTRIVSYLERLDATKYIDSNANFLFTSDIKSLSGAVLHKLVFSYKMAYIKAIEEVLNIKLPIILDSPSGRELDPINIEETFKILSDDFKDNQIIIASIFNKDLIDETRIIQIENNLMEDADLIFNKMASNNK